MSDMPDGMHDVDVYAVAWLICCAVCSRVQSDMELLAYLCLGCCVSISLQLVTRQHSSRLLTCTGGEAVENMQQ